MSEMTAIESGNERSGLVSQNKVLDVLIIEKNDADFFLLMDEIHKANFTISPVRIISVDELNQILFQQPWDLIISSGTIHDEKLLSALGLTQTFYPTTPFIVITPASLEEQAIQLISQGASDYVLRENLVRIIPIIKRIVTESVTHSRKLEFENKLKESDERFKLLAESIKDMFVALDQDFRCTYWNTTAEKWTGIQCADAIGKNVYELFPHMKGTEVEEKLLECIASAQPQVAEISYKETHPPRHYQTSIYPAVEIYSIIVKDITTKKETEAKLKATNDELETFMYRVSHDIRGPVASLMGLVNLARAEGIEGSAEDYFCQGGKMIQRLDDIVRSLADITRIRTERLQPERTDINTLYQRIYSKHPFKEQKLITIRFTPYKPIITQSDPRLLEIIFEKLIQNAMDYRHPFRQGVLDIAVESDEQNITMTFRDNGVGIPEEIQDKIFNMFYRGNINSKGSGLGLYLVRSAVEKLTGSISLVSRLNEGTVFRISLPKLFITRIEF